MSNFAILQALVFEPSRAFAELDQRPRFWWPLLLVVLASTILSVWYVSVVDLEWLSDQQIRNSAFTQNMTDAEIDRMTMGANDRRGLQMVIGGLGTLVVVPIVMLITAAYYLLAGKVTGVERSYRHWLSFTAWTSMPTVLAVFASLIVLLTVSTSQVSQEALQPLSLNALLFHRAPGEPGYTLYSSINLLQFASLALAAIGVKAWSHRSWLFSIIFSALPFVLIYGIWAFFSLR